MPDRFPSRSLLGATLVTGLGFFLLGYGAILLMPKGNSAALIWPATAFAACMILRHARGWRERGLMLAAVLAADLLNNGLGGDDAVVTLGFSIVNLAELAFALAIAGPVRPLRAANARQTAIFNTKMSLLPPLGGALASMAVMAAAGQPHVLVGGMHWFIADALGFFTIFPIGMTISWRRLAKLHLRERLPLALVTCGLLSGVTLVVFWVRDYPLHFLIMPAALMVTRWFRLLGAAVSIVLIAAIVLAGPTPALPYDPLTRVQFLQLFLAVCSLLCVRVAGVLNERDLHVAIIERRHRRAVRASRFKSQLLAHVSHEVRSPLSAIIGFSSLLESGSLSAGRAPEFAAIIGHNGELLQRLHDDLLDLSRAEAGHLSLNPQRVTVAPTLESCVGAIRRDATLAGKEVLIEADGALAFTADPVRLAQILNNLIANAFKYGDNHSPIRLKASALDDRFGRIEVVNAGPGIPAAERSAIFKPFHRNAEVGRNVPGAGLGLSIAKMLVEAQGGRIDFDSVPGRQTRFWIDLPLAA